MICQDNKICKLRISALKAYNTHSKLNTIDSQEQLIKAKQTNNVNTHKVGV